MIIVNDDINIFHRSYHSMKDYNGTLSETIRILLYISHDIFYILHAYYIFLFYF